MSVSDYLHTFSDCVVAFRGADVSLYVQGLLGWLILDYSQRSVNVVNIDLLPQIEGALDKVDALIKQKQLYMLIVTSGKPHSFIAGADIAAMYPNTDQPTLTQAARTLQSIVNRVEALPIPTLAAINGAALGAGLELALACDWRVCSDDRRVVLGLPEVKLGLLPGAGGTVRLPEVVGLQEALGMILGGGNVRAARAKKIGLVDAIIEEGDRVPGEHRFWSGVRQFATQRMGRGKRMLPSRLRVGGVKERLMDGTGVGRWIVAEMAARKLDQQTKGHYPAPYYALDSAVQSASGIGRKQSLEVEARYFGKLGVTPESKALMALFYLMEDAKKNKPLAAEAPVMKLNKVAVIGAGVMGWQIAFTLASKGISVYLRDLQPSIVERALHSIEEEFAVRVRKGKLKESDATKLRALITAGVDLAPLQDCDLVIEAAVEKMEIKQRILRDCEQIIRPTAVFSTNTSSLSITELAASSTRPGRVLGIHFFQPVARMPLVEVVTHEGIDAGVVASAYELVLGVGKVPVLCTDSPGFIVNRILGAYMQEAGRLALEGRSITEVDEAMVAFGMPMGPFRLMDEVGLDVAGHVGSSLEKGLGSRFTQVGEFQALLQRHPDQLGKKTGKGFYQYSDDGKPITLNPILVDELADVVNQLRAQPQQQQQPASTASTQQPAPPSSSPSSSSSSSDPSLPASSPATAAPSITRPAPSVPILSSASSSSSSSSPSSVIVDRCVLLMVNEAQYMLSSHVVSSPSTIDLAMILGTGFPPFLGGLLAYADSRGLDEVVNRLLVLRKQCTSTPFGGDRFKPAEELLSKAERGERFYPNRPDPRRLKRVEHLPRSRL